MYEVICPDAPRCRKPHEHEERWGKKFLVLERRPSQQHRGNEMIRCVCNRSHEHPLDVQVDPMMVELGRPYFQEGMWDGWVIWFRYAKPGQKKSQKKFEIRDELLIPWKRAENGSGGMIFKRTAVPETDPNHYVVYNPPQFVTTPPKLVPR